MKSSWMMWLFVIAVVVVVFIGFNYQSEENNVSMSELFPEADDSDQIEFEFVDESSVDATASNEEVILSLEDLAVKTSYQEDGIQMKEMLDTQDGIELKQEKVVISTPKKIVKNVSTPKPTKVVAQANLKNIPYTIQVASFRVREKADVALDNLKKKKHPGFIVQRNLGNKGVWYRVYVGEFKTKTQANSYLTSFKNVYKDSFVIAPKKSK